MPNNLREFSSPSATERFLNMSDLLSHSKFLEEVSKGGIPIHANWEIYPTEHGWEEALGSFGQFPQDSTFTLKSDVDRCFLFQLDFSKINGSFAKKCVFYVSVWHEDVIKLLDAGYITGASKITERERERRWQEYLKNFCPDGEYFYTQFPDGTQTRTKFPDLENYDDDDETWAVISESGLVVMEAGFKALHELMGRDRENLQSDILSRVKPIVDIGLYDTAIREACLILENRLRELTSSDLYVENLVKHFISKLKESGKYFFADLMVLDGQLRSVFKFVRNDYMHNLKNISEEQCYAILGRLSVILRSLEDIELD